MASASGLLGAGEEVAVGCGGGGPPPPQSMLLVQPVTFRERGGLLTGSNMDVNNKNNRVGGRATCVETTGGLTEKLLANPHLALRKEPRRRIL